MQSIVAKILVIFPLLAPAAAGSTLTKTIDRIQPKIVKIHGAGGFQGMKGAQSGVLISPDGLILTAYTYALDTEEIAAVLADGRRFDATLLGADPRLEVALLKIDASGLPFYDLGQAVSAVPGERILALSNAFGVAVGNEEATVQRGTISIIARLEARRGVFDTPYHGPVYVLDATTNNPGSAGGALVTRRGELVGMLGKELRNALNDTWLNYAIPIAEIRPSVNDILAGKMTTRRDADPERKKPTRSLRLESLGIALVPDVLERTPPFVDLVAAGSPAARAGIRPDDLIVLVDGRLVQSCKTLAADLAYIDHEDALRLTVLRGRQTLEFSLRPDDETKSKKREQP